jgi:hypothetical protein
LIHLALLLSAFAARDVAPVQGGFCFAFAAACFLFASAFAGIRDVALARRRCPCAGRHLLSLPPQRK